MEYLLFLFGFILIIKGGDSFVDASINIAKKFHISEIIIGATIVAIGTTLPETLVSATSAIEGHGDISFGNAIGSIICNTSLICALSLIFVPSKINKNSLYIPSLFLFVPMIIYIMYAYTFRRFSRPFGIILILIFVFYAYLNVSNAKENHKSIKSENKITKNINPIYEFFILIISALVIAIGAKLLVDYGIIIAKNLHIPEQVIGITIIALGTSLPELVTAIISIKKKHGELSIGNIIGANMLNILNVSGIAISLNPFSIPSEKLLFGYNSSLIVDIPLMFLVNLIMVVPCFITGKTMRWQGILLLFIYIIFIYYQFVV